MTTSAGDGKGWLRNMYHTNNNNWQAQWSLTYQYRWCCSQFGEDVSSDGEMATVLMSHCWQQPHKFCENCMRHVRVWGLHVKNTVAKKIANPHDHKCRRRQRVIDKHVPHKQQQVTSTMIPYLSIQTMLHSVWRRGQQRRRDGYCSHVSLMTATTQILWKLRASRARTGSSRKKYCS